MPKAVLCDIDGTLLDSNRLHAQAWVESFAHFGIQAEEDKVVRQIGKGGNELLPCFLPPDQLDRLEKPIKEFRKKLFAEKYIEQVKPFPQVRPLLERMREAGLRLSLASSSDREQLDRLKGNCGIVDLLEQETSSADAEKAKPHPDIFQAAMGRMSVKPSECLALGDTPWDIEAAKSAGLGTVAVTCGGWSEEELRQSGAVAVYRDPADLLARFESSPFSSEIINTTDSN